MRDTTARDLGPGDVYLSSTDQEHGRSRLQQQQQQRAAQLHQTKTSSGQGDLAARVDEPSAAAEDDTGRRDDLARPFDTDHTLAGLTAASSPGDAVSADPYSAAGGPPQIRVRDTPDTAGRAGEGAGERQVPIAASPLAAAAACGAGMSPRAGLMSPRSAPSPRHFFDLEQHMAAVDAALPVSPGRSTAAMAAIARAAGQGVLLPSGAAGEVLDEEALEDIMDECVARGAWT